MTVVSCQRSDLLVGASHTSLSGSFSHCAIGHCRWPMPCLSSAAMCYSFAFRQLTSYNSAAFHLGYCLFLRCLMLEVGGT